MKKISNTNYEINNLDEIQEIFADGNIDEDTIISINFNNGADEDLDTDQPKKNFADFVKRYDESLKNK